MKRPLLAITMGDPAGIGPEVIAAAWETEEMHSVCRPLVVGHPDIMRQACELRNVPASVVEVRDPEDADSQPHRMCCLRAGDDESLQVRPAQVDPRGGKAALEAVVLATELALANRIDGITTAPLNKAALSAAGSSYVGHTELLASLCKVSEFAMMLYVPHGERIAGPAGLGVVHLTLHCALRDIFEEFDEGNLLTKIRLAEGVMSIMQGDVDARPRVGVCAVNPHAGDEGLFGDEEATWIRPAVLEAQRDGIRVDGPFPADALMVRATSGEFDAVVAMYHDQGHIALKLLDRNRAVNITLGLPIVRTSVAHGTAFDLAWQGKAEFRGLLEALRVAAQLARRRRDLPWMGNPSNQPIEASNPCQ